MIFLLFIVVAAWWDLKQRAVPFYVYAAFGAAGLWENFYFSHYSWVEIFFALIPGFLLILLTKLSNGSIGIGDGCFFLVAGIYQSFWNTLALLFYGLLFCSMCSMGIIVFGFLSAVSVRKRRLPFLPFLIPAWMFIQLLK